MLDNTRLALFHLTSWSARILLLVVATWAPWWYGGAQWQSQTWLVSIGLWIAALTWAATSLSPRRTSGCVSISYLMVAFMLLVAMQAVPLPGWLSGWVSGGARHVQAVHQAVGRTDNSPAESPQPSQSLAVESGLWSDPAQHRTLSVAPLQTRAALAVLALATVALWSSATLMVSKRWVIVMAIALATSGLLNGLVGLFQLVNHARHTLLVMPDTQTYFATFVSRNSAPGYYATCLGAALAVLGIAFRTQKRKRRQDYRVTYPGTSWLGRLRNRMEDVFIDLNSVAVTSMLVVIFLLVATLATYSRGGVVACGAASLLTIILTLGSRGDWARASVLAGVVLLSVLGMLSFFEIVQPLAGRLDQLNAVSGEDARLAVWRYSLSAFPSYWFTGCGLGTFRFAILPFHTSGPNVWFHHAENLPLEILIETGLPGLALALAAAAFVGYQLYIHSRSQNESLLMAAALFASTALAIQNLVDFSLILPGVFLPYCLLMGAFLGRCRRVDNEQILLEELGPDALDARKRAKLGHRAPSKGKIIGHSLVASSSILCMLWGANSLSGYAVAGNLKSSLSQLEKVTRQADSAAEAGDTQQLEQAVGQALGAFPHHPEVGLVSGQIEQYLWRMHASRAIDWGDQYTNKQKLQLATPAALALVARSSEVALQPLRQALQEDSYGQALAQASYQRFEQALLACPLDPRAAWGSYSTNLGWQTEQHTSLLLANLKRLTNNNPTAQTEIGLLALSDGRIEEGLTLLVQAVNVDPTRLNRETLRAVASRLTEAQFKKLLNPQNPARVAMVAKWLTELAPGSLAPEGEAAQAAASQLALQVRRYAYQLLTQPIDETSASVALTRIPRTLDDYLAMAWVANQEQDRKLEAVYLKEATRLAQDSFALSMRLALLLHQSGRIQEAVKELHRVDRVSDSQRQQREELHNKWLGKVDPKL